MGLVTGACLADFGNRVVCVDSDRRKIESLSRQEIPFFEPGLPEIVARNVQEGRLGFSSDLGAAIRRSKIAFISVGTPPRADGSAETRAIFEVAAEISRNIHGHLVVVQKSTAPVGTARAVGRVIQRHLRRGNAFDVASNPEFLREGSAIETFMRPDRVVIGVESSQGERVLRKIYQPLFLLETPMVVTNLETAELIKYASNAFLATKVSFINEIANVCEGYGADVQVVAKAMGMDRRIGPKFLHAGPGYGGSCFPKDTLALSSFARSAGARTRIVEATIAANDGQKQRMIHKILEAIGSPRGKRVAVLGLSFKPNTDDLRESPALAIVAGLRRRGIRIAAFDPVAMPGARRILRGVEFAEDPYAAARGAHAVVIVTEWNEFRGLNLRKLRRIMRRPLLCDLRNVYEPEDVVKAGLRYVGVGRGRSRTSR